MLLCVLQRAASIVERAERPQAAGDGGATRVFLGFWQHLAKTHTIDNRPTGILETHVGAQRLPLLEETLTGWAIEGAKLFRSALHGNIGERRR